MIRRAGIFAVVVALIAAATAVIGTGPSSADQNEGSTPALVDAQRLVAVGGLHTCAVMDSGVVRCWGDNANGQLGNGTRAVSTEPGPVSGIGDAVAITAGNTHTCALLKDATVMCWGLNSNGQVGADPVLVNSSTLPLPVPGLVDVRAIAAGGFHNCALLGSGQVKCWGLDGPGQLGDGAGTPSGETFTPVEVLGITDATALAAGEFHTCALLATGGVKCWGHNGFGQLGNDSDVDSTTPVPVNGLPDGAKKALNITAGYGHSCAVVDDADPDPNVHENTIRCWGSNSQGQLGDGRLDPEEDNKKPLDSKVPVKVRYDDDPSPFVYHYVDFTGADVVTGGQQHTCARTVGGGAWCWGNAGRGQIGNGTKGEGHPPAAEELQFMWRSAKPASIAAVDAITAGGFHTCALTGASMQCWGYNFYGQLGSYLSSSDVPVTVTAQQGAASVATGTDAACARILVPGTPDTYNPVCWGTNAHGELGANLPMTAAADTTIAVQVHGQTDVSAITAGNGHACALPAGTTAPVCWGNNDDGQLGNASTTDSNVPVSVSGLAGATQLSAGGRRLPEAGGPEVGHTCARLNDGTAQCWGENADGQLGNNSATTGFTTPQTVLYDADPLPPDPGPPVNDHLDLQPLPDVVQVAAGGTHSCALRDDGINPSTVWCWGRNLNGQIGDNTVDQRRLATQVKLFDDPDDDPPDTYLSGVSAITAGERHTCALMAGAEAGRVRCWGANNRGQLGDGTTFDRHLPTLMPMIPFGSGVSRNPLAVALTAGRLHTCAIMDNASARCWGDNADGQLGHGGGSFSTSPVTPVGLDNDTADTIRSHIAAMIPPPDPPLPDDLVTSLSAGRRNTCATLIDMTVSCWGDNTSGQLGDGVGPTRTTPISVGHLYEGVNGNSSPTAVDDAATTLEDTPIVVDVIAGTGPDPDSDPDGDSVTVLQVIAPAHGAATGSGSTVSYTPDPNYCGTDTVPYRIFDQRNGVDDAVLEVTISCVPDAPVAVNDSATTPEDVAVTVAVLDNDTDPDIGVGAGDTLEVDSVTQPTSGSSAVVAGGVNYTPDPDFTGTDSFDYVVRDAAGASSVGTVTITVTAGNDPPVALDDTDTTAEDTAKTVAVLANDTDIDGDVLAVSSVTQPAFGATVIVAGTVKYTPAANYTGPDTFDYVVSDGNGGTDTGTVFMTVSAENDTPTANDDAAATTRDVVVTVFVLANDTDADGDTLTIASVTQPSHGSAEVESDAIKYTPAPGYSGPDSFTYTAADGNGGSDSATVSITVGPGNYPPFAGDDMATVAEDGSVTVAVLANDFDPDGDSLTVVVNQPAHGETELVPGGIKYTPAPNYWGSDSFTYVVSDGNGGTDTAAVTITVTAVADAPDAVDDARSTPEDTPVTIAVLSNDTDPDGDVVSVSSVTQPAHGSAAIVPGGVRYTPEANYAGPDSFTYTVSDGNGGVDTATVSVTVTAVNDAPTLDSIADLAAPWGATVETFAVGDDIENDPLTYSLVASPSFAAIAGDGTITFTPDRSHIGLHTITVRVSDGVGSADRSFRLTVTKQATTMVYDGVTSGQYSDAAFLGAKLTGLGGAAVSAATVAFSVAGQSASAATDGGGTASTSLALTGAPGSASVVASFAGSSAYEPASVSTPFTVGRERATITVTGPGLVLTSATSAPATLTATVQEESDGSAGSLGGSQVQFTDITGTVLCTAGLSAPSAGSGTASCASGALALSTRGVIAKLVSTRYMASVDVGALAVAAVPSGSAAGGGSVADGGGQRGDFAFRVSPAKKGALPAGDAVQVFRQQADLGGGPRPYAFVVSTSSFTSFARTCAGRSVKVCSATIHGSAATTVAVDLETGAVVPVDGTSGIRIDATDNAEPAGTSDRYAVSVTGDWPVAIGTPTSQQLLTGGNVRIPV